MNNNELISAAMGHEHYATIILERCNLCSVYTGEMIPNMQIAIYKDRISYVGHDASHTRGPHTKVIDAKNRRVCPGYADSHIHIDQFVMPSEFAKRALLCGVTALFSDPIDVTNVAGYRGFKAFLDAGRDLPIRIFQTIPGGLPVDPQFSRRQNNGKMSLSQQTKIIRENPDVIGMGEVFSWTKVVEQDSHTMRSISNMIKHNCIINGHTAGASEKKLEAYIAAGILSCHEPIDYDQVIQRLRLGMWVMIREGFIRRDLSAIITALCSKKTYVDRLMFCTDGLDPAAINKYGHIDYCISEAVRLGVRPIDAITMATRNVFDYYKLERELGGIAPGRLADILVLQDDSFRPHMAMVGGQIVISNKRLVVDILPKPVPSWIKRTVKIPKMRASNFEIKAKKRLPICANTIVLKTEIITGAGLVDVRVDDDCNVIPYSDMICKVAALGRINDKYDCSVAFLQGFGCDIGAFASTWSFHENDMIILGTNNEDMAIVANHLKRCNGGVAIANHGKILASMPLEFAGIISTAPFDHTLKQHSQINDTLADAGCSFKKPILIPLFLPFLALPSVRLTSNSGMINVKEKKIIKPLVYRT